MSKKNFHVECRDSYTGMRFDFELDSTNRRAAEEEAHCKYKGVVRVYRYDLRRRDKSDMTAPA